MRGAGCAFHRGELPHGKASIALVFGSGGSRRAARARARGSLRALVLECESFGWRVGATLGLRALSRRGRQGLGVRVAVAGLVVGPAQVFGGALGLAFAIGVVDHGVELAPFGLFVPFAIAGKRKVARQIEQERYLAVETDLNVTAGLAMNVFPGDRRRGEFTPWSNLRCPGTPTTGGSKTLKARHWIFFLTIICGGSARKSAVVLAIPEVPGTSAAVGTSATADEGGRFSRK